MQTTISSRKNVSSSATDSGNHETAPFQIDLHAWYYLIREKVWWIAGCGVATIALAFLYLKLTPPLYTAQCVVQVEQEARVMSSKLEEVNPEDFKTLESLKTVEGALESRSLLLRVVKINKLDATDPDFQAHPGEPPLSDADLADLIDLSLIHI